MGAAKVSVKEIDCQGCEADYAAAQAVMRPKMEAYTMPDGKPGRRQVVVGGVPQEERAHTDAAAASIARAAHERREAAAFRALQRLRLERNAAGKHALRPTEDLKDYTDAKGRTVTVAQFKARAQAALDAMDAQEAVEQ